MLVLLLALSLNSFISVFVAKLALENGMSVVLWSMMGAFMGVLSIPIFIVHKKLLVQRTLLHLPKPCVGWLA